MIKSIGKVLAAVAVGVSLAGCNDFFDLQPTNEMVLDDFWKSEDDVKAVTGSCYRNMQESDFLKRVIVWGEFRSDNMLLSPSNGDDNLRYIANLNLLPSNGYTSWGNFYNVINLCNTVEHFAPGLRGVEFPPDGHEIRNGVLPPFGQRKAAAVDDDRRREAAVRIAEAERERTRKIVPAVDGVRQPCRRLMVKFR